MGALKILLHVLEVLISCICFSLGVSDNVLLPVFFQRHGEKLSYCWPSILHMLRCHCYSFMNYMFLCDIFAVSYILIFFQGGYRCIRKRPHLLRLSGKITKLFLAMFNMIWFFWGSFSPGIAAWACYVFAYLWKSNRIMDYISQLLNGGGPNKHFLSTPSDHKRMQFSLFEKSNSLNFD